MGASKAHADPTLPLLLSNLGSSPDNLSRSDFAYVDNQD